MVRIIRPSRGQSTVFYTTDIEQLRTILTDMGLMSNKYLHQATGAKGDYIRFNDILTDDQKQYIQKHFKHVKSVKMKDVISGFTGCLITGFNLKFK